MRRLWLLSDRIAADYADDVQPCVASGALARDAFWRRRKPCVASTSGRGKSRSPNLEDEDALWGSQGGRRRQAGGRRLRCFEGRRRKYWGRRPRAKRRCGRENRSGTSGTLMRARSSRRGPADAFARKCRGSVRRRGAVPARRARAGCGLLWCGDQGLMGTRGRTQRAVAALGVSVEAVASWMPPPVPHEIPSEPLPAAPRYDCGDVVLDPRSSTAAEHTPAAARTGSPAFSTRPCTTPSHRPSLENVRKAVMQAISAKSPSTARCDTSGSARTILGPARLRVPAHLDERVRALALEFRIAKCARPPAHPSPVCG